MRLRQRSKASPKTVGSNRSVAMLCIVVEEPSGLSVELGKTRPAPGLTPFLWFLCRVWWTRPHCRPTNGFEPVEVKGPQDHDRAPRPVYVIQKGIWSKRKRSEFRANGEAMEERVYKM